MSDQQFDNNVLTRDDVENELKLEHEKSIMSQWMNSIVDRWIYSKREHEFNKYWKITSVYIKVGGRDYNYSLAFDQEHTKIVFHGYFCRMWDDNERSYFMFKDLKIDNFDFNRYLLVSDKSMIESLDFRLAKDMLENKVNETIDDFDEYF